MGRSLTAVLRDALREIFGDALPGRKIVAGLPGRDFENLSICESKLWLISIVLWFSSRFEKNPVLVGFGVQSCKWQLAASWQDGKIEQDACGIQVTFNWSSEKCKLAIQLIEFLFFFLWFLLCLFFMCQAGSSSAISKLCRCSRRLEDEAL